jgi:hypothetical protein
VVGGPSSLPSDPRNSRDPGSRGGRLADVVASVGHETRIVIYKTGTSAFR